MTQLSTKLAYLCHLEGELGTLPTTPCACAKCPYTGDKDCSKLRDMQDRATNHDAEPTPPTNRLTEASRDESDSQQLGETNRETRRLGQRHTVREAAEALGTTVDAVRGRIRRGTLDSVKLDGVVYVLLDATNREQHSDQSDNEAADGGQQTAGQSGLAADQSELVGEMRGQIDWLRREVERKDTIIMQMAQRIPELEAAPEPRESRENTSERSPDGIGREEEKRKTRRSWWARVFLGPEGEET